MNTKPDFGQRFFDRHQTALVRFANTFVGRRFFQFRAAFKIGRDFIISGLTPNAVIGNDRLVKVSRAPGSSRCDYCRRVQGKQAKCAHADGDLLLERDAVFSTDNHYQKRLEHAYRFLTAFVPQATALGLLRPQTAFGFLPMVALTVSTFYPEAGSGTDTTDGWARRYAASGESWSSMRGGNGDYADYTDTGGSNGLIFLQRYTDGVNWQQMRRPYLTFLTSSLTSSAIISSTVFSIYVSAVNFDQNGQKLAVTGCTLGTNNIVVSSDYQNAKGSSRYCDTDIDVTSLTTSAYNDWTFNATGKNGVNKTGVTGVGVRFDGDLDNVEPSGSGGDRTYVTAYYADNGSNKPKLVVTYTTPIEKNLTETVVLVGTLAKQTNKPLSQTIAIASSLSHSIARFLADQLTVGDTAAKQTGRSLTQSVAVGDARSSAVGRSVSETVVLADARAMSTGRALSETTVVGDDLSILKVFLRDLPEVIVITDTLSKVGTFFRSLIETITPVDTINRTSGRSLSETVVLAASFARGFFKALVEQLTAPDTMARQTGRSMTETVAVVDARTSAVGRSFSEVITLVSELGRGLFKVLNEQVNIVSAVAKTMSRALSTETVTVVDTRTATTGRSFTEVVTLVSSFGRALFKALTETITITGTIGLIWNGITAGLWARQARTTGTWTKQPRS